MSPDGDKTKFGVQIKSLEIDMAVAKERIDKMHEEVEMTQKNASRIENAVSKILVNSENMKGKITAMNERFDKAFDEFSDHVKTSIGFRDNVIKLNATVGIYGIIIIIIIGSILKSVISG